MEDKIAVNLGTDHAYECATDIIGRVGEGNTSRLEIVVPEKLCGCSIYLDFEKPNGEKHRTPKLEVENGVAYYEIEPYLLTNSGDITVQAVLQTENGGIWKSSVKKYINQHSINAFEEVPEQADFMANAERVMADAEQQLADGLAEYNQRFTEIFTQFDQELNELAEMVANDDNFISKVGEINAETLAQNTQDIAKNTEDIAKNAEDITTLIQQLANIAPYSLVEPNENGEWLVEYNKVYRIYGQKKIVCEYSYDDTPAATARRDTTVYGEYNEEYYKLRITEHLWENNVSDNYSRQDTIVFYNLNSVVGNCVTGELFMPNEQSVKLYITGATKVLVENPEPYLR